MRVGSVGSTSMTPVDDPELVGEPDRLPDARDRRPRTGGDVGLEHLAEVHAVDVVCADDDDDVRGFVVDEVQALQDRVGRPREPPLAEPLLCGHRRDVGVQQRRHPPRLRDVTVEAVGLVLGQHDELAQARVDEVRDGEVDQAVLSAERDGRLRSVDRERHEPLALPAREDDAEDLLVRPCHGSTLGGLPPVY